MQVRCTSCGSTFEVEDRHQGSLVRCPVCGNAVEAQPVAQATMAPPPPPPGMMPPPPSGMTPPPPPGMTPPPPPGMMPPPPSDMMPASQDEGTSEALVEEDGDSFSSKLKYAFYVLIRNCFTFWGLITYITLVFAIFMLARSLSPIGGFYSVVLFGIITLLGILFKLGFG